MDQTLLNEMLTSLRIIRDEISILRQEDTGHHIRINHLTEDVNRLEGIVLALKEQNLAASGGKAAMGKIAAIIVTAATLAATLSQYLVK